MKMKTTNHGSWKRFLSLFMAFALFLTLVPVSAFHVEAAAGDTLYLVPSNSWKTDNARFAAYFFGAGETWLNMTDTDGNGSYECTVPTGGYTNVIFCRMDPGASANTWDNTWNQTADLTLSSSYNCFTCTEGAWDGDTGTWSYIAAEEPEASRRVVVHYRNTNSWSSVYGYAWDQNSEALFNGTWPGKVLSAAAGHSGWYTMTLDNVTTSSLGVIFGDGGTNQTGDISVTGIPASGGEYWYDGSLYTSAPSTWVEYKSTCDFTFHLAANKGWNRAYLYTWTGTEYPTQVWPGTLAPLDADGFHTLSFTAEIPEGEGLNYIFNNGGNGGQTIDLSISAADVMTGKVERWVVPTTEYVDDDLTNIRYYCDIFNDPGYVAISPVVDGTSVTFRYRAPDASAVKVWCSMNNWVSGYAMTKDSYGVWSTTLTNVTPGNHSYKFTVDGNWVTDPYNHQLETESSGNQNSVFMVQDPNAVDNNKVTVKIHYTRSDYTNWNCWIWTLKQAAGQYDFVQENGERVATVEVVGRDTQYVSFIPRKSVGENKWAAQEFGERKIFLSDIVSGTVHYYITEGNYDGTMVLGSDVIKENKISSVELDYTNNKIIVTTNQVISCDPMDALKIVDTTGSSGTVAITSIEENGATYTLSVNKTLDLVNLYRYKINFLDQKNYTDYPYDIQFTNVYATDKFAEEFTYTGGDLGATWTSTKTTFKLWAPTAASVQVALYKSGTEGTDDQISTLTMTKGSKGVWTATKTGNQNGVYYTYLVTVNGKTVETCDPYARTTGVNGMRSMIIDLDSTDPEGWEDDTNPNPITSYTDAIIYELHVRDFSIDDSSGVSAANRGKFLALTETGTNYNGVATGLDYMKELGITHLHLLPVYDFAATSVDETKLDTPQFNWGYDPQNYNVPEGSYSTDPYHGEVRVKEFKQMVKTLHDNDISVVMDVVYNHVSDAGKFPFNMVVPNYFSRQNADGSFSNGSGCGNDTASEREMVRDYIVSSVMYWKEEYHIDGFRFDLVGLLDATTINQIVDTVHAKYPDVIFYGEGWTMGTAVEPGNTMATQANSAATPEFGYFSDTMRNLLAGSNGSTTGFVSGADGKESGLADSFMARPGWTSNPQQIVQYASCHDNYTLMDKLVLSTGKTKIDSDLMKMSKLTGAIYLMAQGVPFIHAGEEFFREKIEEDGTRCENSYNAPDSVNHIEWSVLANSDYAAASDYYQGLIEFRKAHSALRLSNAYAVYNNVYCNKAEGKAMMFTVNGGVNGEIADKIIVLYNANNYNYTFYLPSGTWNVCVDANRAGTEVLYTASGSVTLPGISAMVLVLGDTGATHTHSYTSAVTAPTCTAGGYTTYTCSCGDSYTGNQTAALGHSYSAGKCTRCGAADPDYTQPSDPAAADYYLVGYINGADYGCEADYENLGQYKFVNGKLTATFSADSYVFVKTGDNAHWYLFEQYCQTTSGTLYENKTEKMFVPGNVELTFTLTENTDGSLTLSYQQNTAVPSGTVEPKSATLSLEDEVLINLYFIVEEMDVTADDVGMLIYKEKPETANVATADTVIEGGVYNESNGRYMVSTPGIPGQYLADSLYLVAYAKDANGHYVYARTVEYSGKKYCTSQMTKGTAELKATCVALMNYGAAAQQYFAATTDYTYETLMNEEFAQYQDLVVDYSEDLLAARQSVSATKAGTLGTEKNGFTKRSVSMSADGDFSLNYYFTTDKAVDKVTFYYWTADQYASVSKLTLQNASGSKEMVLTDGTNRYWANLAGIAAKDIDKTIFACGVYEVNGVTYSTGVFSYSIGYYCTSKAAGTDEVVKPFAKAIAVYSYHARIFLESLN